MEKLILILVFSGALISGCGSTEVRNGGPKQKPVAEPSESSADAEAGSKESAGGVSAPVGQPESKKGQVEGGGSQEDQNSKGRTEGEGEGVGDAAENSKEVGVPNQPAQSPSGGQAQTPGTSEPNPPSSTPSLPPLEPSKIGWNGTQIVGTDTLYFLPLD